MGLDIYFSEDIRNALLAADEANRATAKKAIEAGADPLQIQTFCEGYETALTTVALAFGLHRTDFAAILEGKRFPVVSAYTFDDEGERCTRDAGVS